MNRPFSVAIASGEMGVGKTLLASNLTFVLKNLGHTVLLIDLDHDDPVIQQSEQDFILYQIGDRQTPEVFHHFAECDYKILMTTPSLTCIESLHRFTKRFLEHTKNESHHKGLQLLVNQIKVIQDRDILYTLPLLYKSFLGLNLSPLDSIYYDGIITQCDQQKIPACMIHPESSFTEKIEQIAKTLIRTKKSKNYEQRGSLNS